MWLHKPQLGLCFAVGLSKDQRMREQVLKGNQDPQLKAEHGPLPRLFLYAKPRKPGHSISQCVFSRPPPLERGIFRLSPQQDINPKTRTAHTHTPPPRQPKPLAVPMIDREKISCSARRHHRHDRHNFLAKVPLSHGRVRQVGQGCVAPRCAVTRDSKGARKIACAW